MKFILGLLLMSSTYASDFSFNIEQAKQDDMLARSRTDMKTFSVNLEYDLSISTYGILGYSFTDGHTNSFGVNKFGTTIDSTTHKGNSFMVGIGFRF